MLGKLNLDRLLYGHWICDFDRLFNLFSFCNFLWRRWLNLLHFVDWLSLHFDLLDLLLNDNLLFWLCNLLLLLRLNLNRFSDRDLVDRLLDLFYCC